MLSETNPGGRWIWSLAEAGKLEDIKKCKRITACTVTLDVAGTSNVSTLTGTTATFSTIDCTSATFGTLNSGNATISSLHSTSDATFDGNVLIGGTLSSVGTMGLSGGVVITGSLDVNGNASITGHLYTQGSGGNVYLLNGTNLYGYDLGSSQILAYTATTFPVFELGANSGLVDTAKRDGTRYRESNYEKFDA